MNGATGCAAATRGVRPSASNVKTAFRLLTSIFALSVYSSLRGAENGLLFTAVNSEGSEKRRGQCQRADSDEVAQAFRNDDARRYDMTPPIRTMASGRFSLSGGGFSNIGHLDPLRVRRGIGIVAVVPVPPLIRRFVLVHASLLFPFVLTPPATITPPHTLTFQSRAGRVTNASRIPLGLMSPALRRAVASAVHASTSTSPRMLAWHARM